MQPIVSVIIVNYNTKDITDNCIKSLITYTQDIDYEIIVVDNCSEDESVNFLQNKYFEYSYIRIIKSTNNIGFGRANNLGVEYASGEYLLLLNSDTLVCNNVVKLFYDKVISGYQNYILGGYLKDHQNKLVVSYSNFDTLSSMLIKMAYLSFPWLYRFRKRVLPLKYQKTSIVEKNVDFITGADMFMSKQVYEQIGGFDPRFFMYCEDEDFCLSASKLNIGRRVICEPSIIHLEGASSKSKSKKNKVYLKSIRYYIKKNIL